MTEPTKQDSQRARALVHELHPNLDGNLLDGWAIDGAKQRAAERARIIEIARTSKSWLPATRAALNLFADLLESGDF